MLKTSDDWMTLCFFIKPAYYKVIIKDRLFSQKPRTLRDIANQFDLTSQGIQFVESQVIEMIRRHFRRYEVNGFLPYDSEHLIPY